MTYSAGYLRVMLLLILVSMMSSCTGCPSSSFDHIVNYEGALEFPLFHTDHLCVQQHFGRPLSTESLVETDLPIDLIQNDSINDFAFLMPIELGTPPVWNLVSIDTGSPLCFVQCEPCTLKCNDQEGSGSKFNPNKSESLRRVGCSERICRTVQSALRIGSKACMEKEDSCLYSVSYGRSSAYSVGKLVTDRIAIGQYEKGYSLPGFVFGCSLDIKYDQHEAGIFGFGVAPFSFFAQVARIVSYKAFSYCFPSDKKKTGYLSIGDYRRVGSTSYTPLFLARDHPVYALQLDKVVANGIPLVMEPSEMIVDTGSRWTVLRSATFSQLETVITEALVPLGYTRTAAMGPGYMCFDDAWLRPFKNWSALPVVELSFDMGATLRLAPQSSFYFTTNYGLCTYFMKGSALGTAVQVLGNSATRSIGVTFDIQGGKFAFRNDDC
ncbi:aspartyl protease family protein At5g10770-like [Lolium rigidum]|uniref:aspartyl protease family protein At5g10770-like n=1 Tax=Lolium rigidum TaxID=89674 RepID=UPI001F5D9A1A|nr:aspartyl protease family protein At5g10770-like [Lolium rigidum]